MRRALAIAAAICVTLVGIAVLLAGVVSRAPQRLRAAAPPIEARSPDGSLLAVVRSSDASIRLIDAHTNAIVRIVHLGDRIKRLWFSPHGRHLYARVRDDARVREIAVRSGAIFVLGER
ncbi:MAG: YncE family protein [Vulcanimicrobiaceae bacterium]